MNRELSEKFMKSGRIYFEDIEAEFCEEAESDIIKVRIVQEYGNNFPKLYARGVWTVVTKDNDYEFIGEVEERYIQNNERLLKVRVLSGVYRKDKNSKVSYEGSRDAVIIGNAGEKFIIDILIMDSEHAVVRGSAKFKENEKVLLRYKELAIASLTNLEDNIDGQYIYNLDFSIETIEKRSKIIELILKEKL